MLQAHDRGTAEVSVSIVAVPKSQAVNASMALVISRSVIEEASNASTLNQSQRYRRLVRTRPAYSSSMCVNDKCKTVKLTSSVDARGANLATSIFHIP